jgi:hypothetical protein
MAAFVVNHRCAQRVIQKRTTMAACPSESTWLRGGRQPDLDRPHDQDHEANHEQDGPDPSIFALSFEALRLLGELSFHDRQEPVSRDESLVRVTVEVPTQTKGHDSSHSPRRAKIGSTFAARRAGR